MTGVASGNLYSVRQRDEYFGPLTWEQLCYLISRRYLSDEDLILAPGHPDAVLLRLFFDAAVAASSALPPALPPLSCPLCTAPLTFDPVTGSAVCPACHGEYRNEQLRTVFFQRPHYTRTVGIPQLSTMGGYDWMMLLMQRPDLIQIAKTRLLRGAEWIRLLRKHPALASNCNWPVLDPEHWRTLRAENLCPAELADFALSPKPVQISQLLRNPELERYINFSRYELADWLHILRHIPSLAASHPEWCAHLNTTHMLRMLADSSLPDELLAMLPADEITGIDWLRLMIAHPRCAKFCRWRQVVLHIRHLPNPDPVVRHHNYHDQSLALHSGQHSCAVSMPELMAERTAIYSHCVPQDIRAALSTEELFLLYDFMQWEEYLPLSGFSREWQLHALAHHPDFGTVQNLWRQLPAADAAEIIRRSPSLFPELYCRAKPALTKNIWDYLLDSIPGRTALMRLVASKSPISLSDFICLRDHGCDTLRRRILRRYLALFILVLILLLRSALTS